MEIFLCKMNPPSAQSVCTCETIFIPGSKYCAKCGKPRRKQPQGPACVHCEYVLYPGARLCANCGRIPTHGEPRQGPTCIHCGERLFYQKAEICHSCGEIQFKKSPEDSGPSQNQPKGIYCEEQSTDQDATGFSQSQGPERCVCGTPFHPGARLCANCGKPAPRKQPQGPPCVYCGEKLIHPNATLCAHCFRRQSLPQKLTMKFSSEVQSQTMPASNPQPRNLSTCVCGTVFRPGARLCANCGKPVPPQGPPCVHCGKKLMTQDAILCAYCSRKQPLKRPTMKFSSEVQSQTMPASNPQPRNLSTCICGTVFHPGAKLCANCGKPVPPQGPPCVHCGKKLMTQDAILCAYCSRKQPRKRPTMKFFSEVQSQMVPASNPQPQNLSVCACGTVFHPGARLCANCGKPVPPQGPPCVHCGKKLMTQDAILCAYCSRKQPLKRPTMKFSSEVQSQTMPASNPQPRNLSTCICGTVFHPGAKLCANCGKLVARKQPHDQRETETTFSENFDQGQSLVARMNQLSSELQQELQRFQMKVDLAESRAKDFEAQLSESQKREKELQNQIEELDQRTKKEREENEQQIQAAEKQVTQAEERESQLIQQHQQELERLRERLQYAEVRVRDTGAELHVLQSQWNIPKSEIELTKEKLGKGAWGKVKVAKFRETRVAAKCYHQTLLSEHNLRLFRREISMAARLRHPNLVQFIGASIEGELILVTELMMTSLSNLMSRTPLGKAVITSISVDILQALNYLHLMQPHPIIHRDICSGNVLLDPLPDNQWKAKVSDYGSVNIIQHLTTAHPGNPFYSAPEAEKPSQQTPKMDIFSLCVLLAEMLTNELPEKKDRECQLLKIAVEHPNFIGLVRHCLSTEHEQRPSAQELIIQLSDL